MEADDVALLGSVFAVLAKLPVDTAEFYVDVCLNVQAGYEDIASMCRTGNVYQYSTHGPLTKSLKVPEELFLATNQPTNYRLIKPDGDSLRSLFVHIMATATIQVKEVQVFIFYQDDQEDQPPKRALDAYVEATIARAYRYITKVSCTHKPHPVEDDAVSVNAINYALTEFTCNDAIDFKIALHLDHATTGEENAFHIQRIDGKYFCNPYGFAVDVPIEQPEAGISGNVLGAMIGRIQNTDLVKNVTVTVVAEQWPIIACETRLSTALLCKVDVKLTQQPLTPGIPQFVPA